MECSHKILHSFNNSKLACQFLKNCSYEYDYFSLLTFNYCTVGNRQWVTWPIIVLIFLLCFYFLSTSVDEYVSRIVGRMSVKLKLSQNLAGLTLLALGNQLADITVAIVSGGDENEGIEASLSTILGADSLIIGFVMPTVIFLGNGVVVKGQNFTRDLLTYLIALIIIFSIGIFARKLNLFFAFIIFMLYIVYVILCIYMENYEKRKKEQKNKKYKKQINEDESYGGSNDFKVKLFDDDEEDEFENENKNKSLEDEEKSKKKNNKENKEQKVSVKNEENNVNNKNETLIRGNSEDSGKNKNGDSLVNNDENNEKNKNESSIEDNSENSGKSKSGSLDISDNIEKNQNEKIIKNEEIKNIDNNLNKKDDINKVIENKNDKKEVKEKNENEKKEKKKKK